MKKRILALFLTLIMLIPVLPAAVSADDSQDTIPELVEKEMNLSDFTKIGSGMSIDGLNNSAKIEGAIVDGARTEFRSIDLLNVFTEYRDEYIIQEICIEKMPVFTKPTKANAHVSSGFFLACTRNYSSSGMFYISFSIFRTDEAGNLSIALATKNEAGSNVLGTAYPLNKKVGDTFKLTTAWYADGRVSLFCDGELIHAYDITATYSGATNSTRKNFIRIGYCSYGAEATDAVPMDVKITLNKLIRGNIPEHVHTPAEDDGDCTTAVMCTSCDEVAIPAMPSHKAAIANFKYATETEKGYTGDQVCYLCNHEISKGEETPVLPKTAGVNSNNQGVDIVAIIVYIVIGVAVLAAAVVVVIVIRKKRNQKQA